MALTPLHVRDVCYGGSWNMCKYMDSQARSDGQWIYVCTKLNPGAFAALEKKRAKYGGTPTADNCAGYLLLQYKEQGYDK